jgi:5-methyltetrahydropteroyltriglutamate--homocysteine methyltransferase
MEDIELCKDFPRDKELGAGVIDVKAFRVETAEDVADRLRKILTFVPPEQLWVNPDCGLWETPRKIAAAKLRAMVEGARLVRAGLGG